VAGWEEPCHPGSGSGAHSIPLSPTMQPKYHLLPHNPAHHPCGRLKSLTITGDSGWDAVERKAPTTCMNPCSPPFCRPGLHFGRGSVREVCSDAGARWRCLRLLGRPRSARVMGYAVGRWSPLPCTPAATGVISRNPARAEPRVTSRTPVRAEPRAAPVPAAPRAVRAPKPAPRRAPQPPRRRWPAPGRAGPGLGADAV